MIPVLMITIPLVAGILAAVSARWSELAARWVSVLALLADLCLALSLWIPGRASPPGSWLEQVSWNWIPSWGARFHLGVDGLSLLLIVLTIFLGIASVLASWRSIQARVGFFHLNLMAVLAGIIGVFLSLDLFLFYFFWELMLVPMYFLIAIWGHENRAHAATKFFLFTQASGLLMLLSILGLYFAHGRATGTYTFDYVRLVATPLGPRAALWLMLGFGVAFAVKLPVFPLHTWLPDAHTEAPTAGSVILAGLLLKTGGYGLIRFVLPLLSGRPAAAAAIAPVMMALAAAGIVYGGVLAYAQRDLKRLVAYTSVSHMGFVLLGIFAGTPLALQGALIQMICHGLGTGGLFILVGAIQDRIHTRDLERMGGIWSIAPRMSSFGMLLALASLGLPGLGGFIGEFLILAGTYQVSAAYAILASLGFVVSTLYSLRIVQKAFHGPKPRDLTPLTLPDVSARETLVLGALTMAMVWIGIYPQQILNSAAAPLAAAQTELQGGSQDAYR